MSSDIHEEPTVVNGVNATELEAYRDQVLEDFSIADRDRRVSAHWVGGSRSRIEYEGETIAHMNGAEDDLNAMVGLLGCLGACDVEVIALKAAFLGIPIEDLAIEARGQFNVARLVDVSEGPSPGFDQIEYVVTITAPDATPEQLTALQKQCEAASPVGHSLERPVSLRMKFNTE